MISSPNKGQIKPLNSGGPLAKPCIVIASLFTWFGCLKILDHAQERAPLKAVRERGLRVLSWYERDCTHFLLFIVFFIPNVNLSPLFRRN